MRGKYIGFGQCQGLTDVGFCNSVYDGMEVMCNGVMEVMINL